MAAPGRWEMSWKVGQLTVQTVGWGSWLPPRTAGRYRWRYPASCHKNEPSYDAYDFSQRGRGGYGLARAACVDRS